LSANLNIEALLWDNDGVLVDTEPLYLQANREILGEINIDLTENLYKEISLRQGRSVFDLATERGVNADRVERLKVARNARYTDLIDAGVQVLEGVREALEQFSTRVPMGIVTSSNPVHFERIHQQTNLLPYFDFVLASGDYVRHKPHPEPYLTGAARHGCPPKRCLAIEDTERGLAAAAAAGMPCIVIPRPLSQAGNFATALHVLESARELPSRIDSLLQS
jgi:HAD superfamily hydrolase (TIGR01509 family)